MNSKKWMKIFFIFTLSGVLLIGGVNYIVDPYQQYRIKTFYPISYDGDKERYKNAGFSKNFSYDSLILGTSMTENFIISEVEKKLNFKKVIKLCVSGGSAKEQSITLETAINHNHNLANVLWGLDTFGFVGNSDSLRFGIGSFPFYLYDSNKLNDYRYLLSIDTFIDSTKALLKPYLKQNDFIYNQNLMYQWQHNNEQKFKLQEVKNDWKNREKFLNYEKGKQTFNDMKKSFNENFLEIIKQNPQIKFKIFFPPYSILTFKIFEERNQVADIINFKKYIFDSLIILPNIEIYDFHISNEVTHNLNNYKDVSHYHQKINTWILEQIKLKNYLVIKQNIDEHLQNLREQIQNYDLNKTMQ